MQKQQKKNICSLAVPKFHDSCPMRLLCGYNSAIHIAHNQVHVKTNLEIDQ